MIEVDHIGIAVQEAAPVNKLLQDLLGTDVYKTEDVASQGVRTHFIDVGSTKLELLESISSDSPIAKYLERRKEGIHHLAFEVSNIQATWQRVKRLGYTPLSEPQPGADNKVIFFLHPRETHGILIEFCQQKREALTTQWFSFKGERLAYYELGSDHEETVVVLHGAAGCTQMETELLARRLSNTYHVVALDFASHGQSDPYEDITYTPGLFIDNVAALFEHLDLKKTRLFGFSLGGFIALAFAYQNPHLVEKLAVHATNLIWDEELVTTMLNRLDHQAIRQKSQELVNYLSAMHGGDHWASLFERMKDYTIQLRDYFTEYADVHQAPMPTLVTAVDKDDLFTVHSPVYLYDRLPKGTLAIIPGQRHALQNVDLDQLVPLILRHFGS